MQTFYKLLASTLIVTATNNFVWFALVFWAYLTTQSVVSTGIVGGLFTVANAISSFWLGSIVDHNKKKNAMIGSSVVSLLMFSIGLFFYSAYPESMFAQISGPHFWLLAISLLLGTIAGSIYMIAMPTLVTLLVPENMRDKANGMFGTVMGVSFAITSVASGFTLAHGGMRTVLIAAITMTAIAILVLSLIPIPEKEIIHTDAGGGTKKVDIKGTIKVISKISGLFALIFFTTFNNFIGGVFMALMDAYGLTLVSVQTWGTLWGFLSFGFIIGGMYIAKYGLGKNPVKTLFTANTIIWTSCILFPLQPSIVLVAIGAFIWMSIFPFIEATEQTIIQKVVPVERQGRVFGFAHSIEQAASPLTAFLIGPLAQFVFIPFMTTGAGVDLIGGWFGTGPGRGMALVFMLAGIIGLTVTTISKRLPSYVHLAERMKKSA